MIRAALFAGATKEEFATWDRTSTRPMDEVFGYGELNILNSYHIFEGGEFAASTSDPATNVDLQGWDYGDFDGSTELFYDFKIDETEYGKVSAVLSWNMNIIDNDASAVFDPTRDLADLNLDLFDSCGTLHGQFARFQQWNGLQQRAYLHARTCSWRLHVSNIGAAGGTSATDYGFAWNIVSAVPEPSSMMILGVFGLGCIARRRRTV